MNLKTHTAYPEIQVDEKFNWVLRIYTSKGKVSFTDSGKGKDRKDAKMRAKMSLIKEEPKYIKEED